MTRILTIIALLLATPAWAGEVDGNSFYCKPMDGRTFTHEAFNFKGDKVLKYNESGMEFSYDYVAGPINVFWRISDLFHYDIDRKTLQLELRDNTRNSVASWQCEFMEINQARELVITAGQLKEEKMREGNQF